MDFTLALIILQLIFLEGILSIDNAAVLGAMVVHLPDDRPITWPTGLRKLGWKLHKFLGYQRTAALRVGLLGAYLGRGLMLLIASFVINNPWLKLVGAIYLIKLACDNLGRPGAGETEEEAHVHHLEKRNFWSVVLTIEVTDLVFSLDNVVVAVTLSDQLWVVLLGVGIGILMMRFAAGLFSYAVEREPVLKNAAYILVFNIGIELLAAEIYHIEVSGFLRFGISILTILISILYAHSPFLKKLRPALKWVAEGMANFNTFLDWLFKPVFVLLKLLGKLIAKLFPQKRYSWGGPEEGPEDF
ncbi:MAG: tellurium resistance protein TerC [Anaerolinea sp.]|nr:tellurium resistance protein TerC [Anaerolinea sp.]